MLQQHRFSRISGELLKDHEEELLRTILSLLLDDADPDDWTTLLFWRASIASYGRRLSFDLRSSPALLMLRDEVLRRVTEQNRPLVLDTGVGILTLVLNQSREDSPPPRRTGSVHPPGLPSAAPPDEHGFICGNRRPLLSKNQSGAGW